MSNQEEPQPFTIDGTIQALQIAPGVVNLIEDIQKGGYFTGVIAGLSGEPGVMANSASLAMYDGEDVEHIALLSDGQLAIGTFEWLRDLNIGDDITVVVSKIFDGPLFVHAILRKKDHLLWTPFSVNHTRRGWIFHAIKLGSLITFLTWLMFGTFFLIDKDSMPHGQGWFWFFFSSIALMTFVMTMSVNGVMHLGTQAEAIFRALDVPRFERFRIKPYSVCSLNYKDDPDFLKKSYIFWFSDALAAHRKKFNLL